MAQLHGQVVTNGDHSGIVQSVTTVKVAQPDRVTRDVDTGEEVNRELRKPIEAQRITVKWENDTESTLTEHLDQWTVLGSLTVFPEIKDPANPPPGAFGELPEQQAATAAVDVAAYAQELRAAAPLAEGRGAERNLEVVDDGELAVVEE